MLERILPHICLDTAVVVMVLWVIDRVNPAMNMLGRDVFKLPFGVFLVLVFTESVVLIVRQRKERK